MRVIAIRAKVEVLADAAWNDLAVADLAGAEVLIETEVAAPTPMA